MNRVPAMASISELKNHHLQVVKRLEESGEVIISQHSRPIAVMVTPERWNAIVDRLEDQEALIQGLHALLQIESGEEALIDLDPSTLDEMATGHAIPA